MKKKWPLVEGPFCTNCGMLDERLRDGVCAGCRFHLSIHVERELLAPALGRLNRDSVCTYCGWPATDVEHVVPRCLHLPTYTVPACRECNGFAGGMFFSSFKEKQAYIRIKIAKKYVHILKMPDWEPDELAEIGYTLASSIRSDLAEKREVQLRLAFEPTAY